jgi:hypothetical protein
MFLQKMPIARSVFAAAVIAGCAATLSPSAAERIERSLSAAVDTFGATLSMISPSAGQRGLFLSPSMTHDSSGTPLELREALFGLPGDEAQTQIGQLGARADSSGPPALGAPVNGPLGGRTTVIMNAEAAFVPASSLSVNLTIEIDMRRAVQQNLAHLSIHSPPGETAVMTCGIYSTNAPGAARDCSGRSEMTSMSLPSRAGGNNVTLTYDLSAASAKDKSIAIEVSYI